MPKMINDKHIISSLTDEEYLKMLILILMLKCFESRNNIMSKNY